MKPMTRHSAPSPATPARDDAGRVLVVVMSDSQYRALLSGIAQAPGSAPGLAAGFAAASAPGLTPMDLPRQPPLACGAVELLLDEPVVHIGHGSARRSATLPPTEHRLLASLLRHAERVCSRELLVAEVWPSAATSARTVDQYVRRLRASLRPLGADGMVQTVNRAGYRLMPMELEDPARVGLVTADSQSLPTVAASTDGEPAGPCAAPTPNV